MVVIPGDMLEPIMSDDKDSQMIHWCGSWAEFQQLAPAAAIAIIMQPELSSELLASIRHLRDKAPSTVLILTTSAAPDNTRHLGSVVVDEVVWQHEPPAVLGAAIRRALDADLFQPLIEQIESAPHLPEVFRSHILRAVRAEPPFRTVKSWAYVTGCTPSELQKQWCRHVGEGGSPREFLRLVREVRRGGPADIESRVAVLAAFRELLLSFQGVVSSGVGVIDCTSEKGSRLIRYFRAAVQQTLVIAVADPSDENGVIECSTNGKRYISAAASAPHLVTSIHAATAGEQLRAPAPSSVICESNVYDRVSAAQSLTARELEVLRIVKSGGSNKAVARRLGIRESTVKNHLHSIFSKLGVKSRQAAATLMGSR